MHTVDVLIAGAGYVGAELARQLAGAGHTVVAARRSPELLPADLAQLGVKPLALDLLRPEAAQLPRAAAVVFAASPDTSTPEGYREAFGRGPARLLGERARAGALPKRAVLVSSTGGFAESNGGWVDETSPSETDDPIQAELVRAEAEFRAAADEHGVRAMIARLGGIYGPGRESLVDSVAAGTATYDPKRDGWSNRIHRDDAAAAIAHILKLAAAADMYAIVDTEPARRREVLTFIAELVGVPPPRAAVTVASNRGGGRGEKRVRCGRLLDSGFTFRYPTFREGYRALVAARRGQA